MNFKNVLIPFIAFAVMACEGSSQSKDASIYGNIKGGSGKTIFFEELGGKTVTVIDSAVIAENGTFAMKAKPKTEGFYRLRLGLDPQGLTLALKPTEKVEIKADAATFNVGYEVKGSPNSIALASLLQEMKTVDTKSNALNEMVMGAQGKPGFDSIRNAATLTYQQMLKERSSYLKNFAGKNSNNLAGLFSLNLMDINEEFPFMDSIFAVYKSANPESKYLPDFDAYLGQYRNKPRTNIGDMAPEINLPTPDGGTLALSSLRGKLVLIDFWASWCGPCRQENPNVVRVYNRFKDKGFEIYGVSLDKTKEAWLKAVEADKLTWKHVSDLKFWQSAGAAAYGVQSIPATVLVDKTGKIIAKDLRGAALEAKIAEILGE